MEGLGRSAVSIGDSSQAQGSESILPCFSVFCLSLQNDYANPNNHGNQFACQCGSDGPPHHWVNCLSVGSVLHKVSILTGAHWPSRALLKAPSPLSLTLWFMEEENSPSL